MLGGEAIVRTLDAFGVKVVFGLCGDTSIPLYEALHDIDHGMRHILTRDERSASFMADAYARLSGKVGVCEGPSGGGATYILPGVAEANDSSVPLVCLTSDIAIRDRGKGTLTELDQQALFRPVTCSSALPTSAAELPALVVAAFRAATRGSLGAAQVTLPIDLLQAELDDQLVVTAGLSLDYPAERLAPDAGAIRAAARSLHDAKRPLIVSGAGVLRSGAWEEVTQLAHLLGAPVATSIGGKGAIAETDPYALGVIGSNGGLAYRHDVLRQSDLLFYIGSRQGSVTTEKWTLPTDGEKRILQLDVDPKRLGCNYRTEVAIASDAKRGLTALLQELDRLQSGQPAGKIDPGWLRRKRSDQLASVEELFSSEHLPIRPERFLAELLPRLPEKTVLLADPGTPCPYFSAYYRLPRAGRWFVSPRAHGGLGYALPASVGAYFAKPEAERIVAVMGDGSFGICCGELETLVRLSLPVTLIVLNNGGYGWIKAGQKQRGGKYYSVDFSDSHHARIAEAFGMRAARVESPGELPEAIEQALRGDTPALLEVVVQPLEETKAPVSKWIA